MAILSRRRQPWDETLPNGSSVYEAVRRLTNSPDKPIVADDGMLPASPSQLLTRDVGPSDTPPEPIRPLGQPMDAAQPAIQPATSLARPALTDTLPSPSVPDLSPTDYYQSSRAIRPRIDPTIKDPQAQLTDYETNLRNFQPQREGAGKILARTALGFLAHGIPGAAYTAGSELLDRRQHDKAWQQNELQRADAQLGVIGARRKEGMQEQLMQSEIDKNEYEPLQRHQAAIDKVAEQERDNLRQLYNAQPYFDPSTNAQHKTLADRAAQLGMLLPSREQHDGITVEKVDGKLFAVNRRTHTASPVTADGQQLVNQADVPTNVTIDGQTFNVTQGQGAAALATAENRQYERTDKETVRAASRTAALARAAQAKQAGTDHLQKAQTLNGQITALQTQLRNMGAVSADDPNRITIQENLAQLRQQQQYEQGQADSSYKEQRDAEAEALKYPADTRSLTRGAVSSRPSPSTHVLNHKAWSGSHDESQWPAAKARATALGYKIVE